MVMTLIFQSYLKKLSMNSIFNSFHPTIKIPFQIASLHKYISKSRTKRLPLTTKRAGKGYYKGNRSRKEGHITTKGRFVKDIRRCTELVVPDLSNFSLRAYIGPGIKRNIKEKIVKL
jgi:hypothetical protein